MPVTMRPDIVIHKPNGSLVAYVEVKNRAAMDPEIATALRRNLIAHNFLPDAPYFMLLSQEKAYLWTNRGSRDSSIAPDVEIPIKEILENYLPKEVHGRLRGKELAIAVYAWLSDLTSHRRGTGVGEDELTRAGFIDAIKGAVLSRESE